MDNNNVPANVRDAFSHDFMCVCRLQLPCGCGNYASFMNTERVRMVMTMGAYRDVGEWKLFLRVLGEDFKGQCGYCTLRPWPTAHPSMMLGVNPNPVDLKAVMP